MKREVASWTVAQLRRRFLSVSFPEYQREKNVWQRADKQALIDSILREFDIAPFYLYATDSASWDCIDGRQRYMALMSFLGETEEGDDPDYRFPLKNRNEVDPSDEHPFPTLDGLTFSQIEERANIGDEPDAKATSARQLILEFPVTIVLLSEARYETEFNLQFARLNLGRPINAAEKLNAMTGDMRLLCFRDPRIGKHPFIQSLGLPNRRFAKESTAAQILAQVFGLGRKRDGGFLRSRHFDLQDLFKKRFKLTQEDDELTMEVERALDGLSTVLYEGGKSLRSRAFAVTFVVFVWKSRIYEDKSRLARLPSFLAKLLEDLTELRKELNGTEAVSSELLYLVDFQRHLTQAAAEKRAIKERDRLIGEMFERWVDLQQIRPADD